LTTLSQAQKLGRYIKVIYCTFIQFVGSNLLKSMNIKNIKSHSCTVPLVFKLKQYNM